MNAPRQIVTVDRPYEGQEPSSFLRQFLFSANMQTQDLTGDPLLSESADSLIEELKGTPVKDTIILGLCDEPARNAMGLMPATVAHSATEAEDPLPSTLGFVHATAPLDTNREVLCCEVILDAEVLPLPDEKVDEAVIGILRELVEASIALGMRLNRPAIQFWLRCPVETSTLHEALTNVLSAEGFSQVYEDVHGFIPASAVKPRSFVAGETAELRDGFDVLSYREHDVPEHLLESVLELFNQGDTDVPTGELVHTPKKWTAKRVTTARNITLDRGDEIISTVLIKNGQAIAITDIARPAYSDKTAAEQTFTLVHRDYRGQGVGLLIKKTGLARAKHLWPEVKKFYCDCASNNLAMLTVNRKLGVDGGASTIVYQKVFN